MAMTDEPQAISAGGLHPPAFGEQAARPLPWSRKIAALFIALIADAPPVCLLSEAYPFVFDLVVAALLWLVLGRSRLLALALLIECIPAVGLVPTWTAYVLFEIIAGKGGKQAPRSLSVPAKSQE
jgi:hypothetical protein